MTREQRGHLDPKRLEIVRRASKKHYAKLKADPVAYRAWLDLHNARRRAYRAAKRLDPRAGEGE